MADNDTLDNYFEEQTRLMNNMHDQSIEARNERQNSNCFHPLTCGNNRHDDAHKAYAEKHGGDRGQLVAVEGGWRCPICDYWQEL